MQPALLELAHGNAAIRSRGLLDRFALLVPPSKIGSRDIDAPSVPESVRVRYRETMLALGRAVEHVDITLSLSAAADARFRKWRRRIEKQLAPTGSLAPISAWGAKAPGRALRIAALLHVADTFGDGIGGFVSSLAMGRAIEIVNCLAGHALAAVDMVGADSDLAAARAVLKWAVDGDRVEIDAREVQRAFRTKLPSASDTTRVLDLLAANHLIRGVLSDRGAKGGRPAKRYAVSPRAREVLSVLSRTLEENQERERELCKFSLVTPDKTDKTPGLGCSDEGERAAREAPPATPPSTREGA
jgi:hypothetical protein